MSLESRAHTSKIGIVATYSHGLHKTLAERVLYAPSLSQALHLCCSI